MLPQHLSGQPARSFNRWGRIFSILLLLCAAPCLARGGLFYRVEKVIKLTDLNPTASGTIPFSVTGLNSSGRMTGYFPSANFDKLHAFVWDNASQTLTDVNAVLAADSSMATCINDHGTVGGIYWELGTYAQKGFVFYADGTISTFTGPDSSQEAVTAVNAINATDSLIGTYTAADNTTRAFIVEQANTGATIVDLGDLGASATYNSYLWPNALNAANQVVGNVYLIPRHTNQRSYTKGFFWDAGMTAVDVSGLSTDWTATGLNSDGTTVGLYDKSQDYAAPFSLVGSYVWDGYDATDVGDLGGGNGASVFTIRDAGSAYGTSLNASGELHLFQFSGGGVHFSRTDLGSVSVFSGDTSFVPLGISAVNAVTPANDFSTGPPRETLDFTGVGTDANGSVRSLLWKDGGIHSVIDLLPAYLSFAAISYDYGSLVLINGSEQIACAGTDASGQQMALLLSVDPDTDNDGLPDSWEMRYYGHLGVGKDDPAAGGGGLTNWQAYQQGSDPNDFYNGATPSIVVVSGTPQTGPPNGFVPLPLIVSVKDAHGNPFVNAPVTFTVGQGGGQMQKSSMATPGASLTVSTDFNGQARAFFKLPNVASSTSQVTAATGSGSHLVSVPFTESSDGGASGGGGSYSSPFDPTNVTATLNRDGSLDVTWTSNADPDDTTPINIQDFDEHGIYHTIATAPAGSTSYHIPAQ